MKRRGLTPLRPPHYGAAAAICLERAAELRFYASRCPWDPESRRDLFEARRRVLFVRHFLSRRAAALLPEER